MLIQLTLHQILVILLMLLSLLESQNLLILSILLILILLVINCDVVVLLLNLYIFGRFVRTKMVILVVTTRLERLVRVEIGAEIFGARFFHSDFKVDQVGVHGFGLADELPHERTRAPRRLSRIV